MEVAEIVSDIFDISDKIDKSSNFDKSNHGHIIFLIFQIIDLFTIVTSGEIIEYLSKLEIIQSKKQLSSSLYILEKFHLIRKEKRSSQTFYFVAPDISDRVDLVFRPKLSTSGSTRRYDKRAIKIEVLGHYEDNQKKNRGFKLRLDLWKRRVGATS